MKNKKWFSFVEIIIVISILALVWIVITKISQDSKEKTINLKIEADLKSISNSLLAYSSEKNELPLPEWNKNFYKNDWSYSHEDFDDKNKPAFWVYGVVPEESLKRYLNEIPRDPKTNQYYSYGRIKDWAEFEVVWVEKKEENYFSKVIWNYKWDRGLIWLVREYNWPHFISDGSSSLPFNPEKILLSATDLKWNIFNEKDVLKYKKSSWKIFKNGENLENIEFSEGNKYYDLYISDWSIARLVLDTDISLTFWKDNNLFTYIKDSNKKSKISMFFEAGSAWVFASKLDNDSELNTLSQDVVAAVRWTIFKFDADKSEIKVYKWIVDVTKSGRTNQIIWSGDEGEIPAINKIEENDSKNITGIKNNYIIRKNRISSNNDKLIYEEDNSYFYIWEKIWNECRDEIPAFIKNNYPEYTVLCLGN